MVPDKSLVLTANEETLPGVSKDAFLPDRKGYNFDGCAPSQLLKSGLMGPVKILAVRE